MSGTLQESVHLHDEHRSIFVNGYGGTPRSCEKQARELSGYIYVRPPQAPSKIEAVCNQPSGPTEVAEDVVENILKYLTTPAMLRKGDGRIRLAIFCHSNGVKAVRQALTSDRLTKALRGKLEPTTDVSVVMGNIRKQLAVITMGGVSLIPDGHAKVVLNFRAEKDYMAKVCHFWGVGDHGGKNTYYRIPRKPDEKKQISGGLFNSVSCTSGFSKHVSDRSAISQRAQTSASDEDNPHYLDKYLKHEEMIEYIQEVLHIDNPYKHDKHA